MTHEPIHTIHFSPHVTWQGTQAELDAMLADSWPNYNQRKNGMSDETLKHCMCGCIYLEADCPLCNKVTDAMRIKELEAKVAKAVETISLCRKMQAQFAHTEDPLMVLLDTTIAELKGESK